MKTTVNAPQLGSALLNVMPHAGKDGSMPVLTTVNLSLKDGILSLAATDRYTLAVQELPSAAGDDGLANLPADFCKRLVAQIKACKVGDVVLTTEGDIVSATFCDGSIVSGRTVDGEFPRYSSLFPTDEPTAVESSSYNPSYLARWSKLYRDDMTLRKNPCMTLTFHGKNRPSVVTISPEIEGFRSLIMQMRMS